jgi:hypothetical protein
MAGAAMLAADSSTVAYREDPMVEVRNLQPDVATPKGDAWVLIEKTGAEYLISARAKGRTVDAALAPRGFDSAEAAIRAATGWADLLQIPLLYVRDT